MSRGWYPIIVELDRRLAELDEDYVVHQVKEKFGGLRYYFEPTPSATPDTIAAMRAAVKEAKSVAERTCEECGASGGVLRGERMYVQTLCEECATKPR
jgi:MinD superfamily P-loop ATPase